ncbi:hypothetical protein GCM10028803_53290 [Larkinella knui]|uniref:Uncharacterized protein n=1 Tax=Larkinella knui TaxID=2025310 RepID=A0A3P1CGT1_9BACT|nr:hypothetical protein [Larkinella knui]RRB12465.1 hypothetical protein EHT87_19900 [Larkinella knui]
MKNRFSLENDEAASKPEAAFILNRGEPSIRARIVHFRTLKQLDEYVPTRPFVQIRTLPVLLEIVDVPDNLPQNKVRYWLDRMAIWYYRVVLKPEVEN